MLLLNPADDIDTALADGRHRDGVYWLAALDDEGRLDNMDLAGWQEALRHRVRDLYLTMRRLWEQSPFLVVATRLGGYHGYDEAGATCPLGGAVTGFAKAYRRERPDALVKAVDFPASRKTPALADLLIEETLRDPGCVEVGHAGGRRWGVGLADRPFSDAGEAGRAGRRQRNRRRGHRFPGHRRRRQHRLRDHRGPGRGLRRHVPPARPHARARSGRPRPGPLRQ